MQKGRPTDILRGSGRFSEKSFTVEPREHEGTERDTPMQYMLCDML